MNRTSCHDDDFGPFVRGCRDDFDFTVLFEDTILSIAPSILALLFSVGRLIHLYKKPQLLLARTLQLSKLVGRTLLMFSHSTDDKVRQHCFLMLLHLSFCWRFGRLSQVCLHGHQLWRLHYHFSMPSSSAHYHIWNMAEAYDRQRH